MTFFPLFSLLLPLCFASFALGATLQQDEVEALKDIGKVLGKNWDFSVDPCSGRNNWVAPQSQGGFQNAVTCDCSFHNKTLCHVVSVVLKAQNLSGTLPPDFVRLPYLQEIDFTLNYLNGTIPKQWATLNLVNISFYGNRLSGPIPKEIGNITTLKSLVLEFNQLSGNLPPELGNLTQIERLLLNSNNFTGELPATFAKLTTLKQFRISDNQFSGAIPNFIQSWINLEMLVIQGSGLSGPIPSGISLLKNLTDLTITDLNGTDSPFPQLDNMSNLSKLVLRSCNIIGAVPEYLGNLTNLKVIDLSNNKLSGQIPMRFDGLKNMYILALSGNYMSGSLPEWIDKPDFVDLSYNNFSITNFEQQTCQQGSVNLFASSLNGNSLGNVSCLANYHCPKTSYSLYINCGGKLITYNGNKTYDDDSNEMGPARFRQSGTNWALITAGHFFDSEVPDYYTWSNTTKLAVDNAELYMDARVSPNSLTYYGFCLGNGNYTVNLHFAEIMFTDDETYSSLGRRVFDIYIQRKLVVKDFNIAKEAGGVGKAVIKNFTAVVTSNALEIRLYWAGKGTTTIPFGSVYGPLISAISVDPDFTPPLENNKSTNNKSTPVGAVVGIVAAGVIAIILVLGIMWWKGCLRLKSLGARERELKGLSSQTGLFTLRQIKAATSNFDESFKIGEGGFGPVYKGILSDGTIVAVKQLSSKSRQGTREFINEIGMISALQHPNLVKLHGFCMEDDQLLLIYEYMENNSLAHALFVKKEDPEKGQLRLDWKTRQRICIGIAKGLAYLHEESRIKIVHRDIKATNVLLDKDLSPKISDFGLAKLNEEDKTHMNTRIAGTYGYMAPEYAMHGYLTDKADVYSFGILVLEIVSGTNNTVSHPQEECFSLLDWVRLLKDKDKLMELVDWRLGEDFNKKEAMVMINVALVCTNFSPALRPSMSSVGFDCLRNGRPDQEYLKYRWKPSACDLPRFDGVKFLERYRGKDIMFVGDSISNNMWQSLTCLLHNAVPKSNYTLTTVTKHLSVFSFPEYQASIMWFKNGYLVDVVRDDKKDRIVKLDSIRSGNMWRGDVLIFNTYHWWTHTGKSPMYYQMGNEIIKDMDPMEAYKIGLTTWSQWIDSNIDPSKTTVLFQGIAASHSGAKGCLSQTHPEEAPKPPYPGVDIVKSVLSNMKVPVYLLDITLLTQLRIDGHPSIYTGQGTSYEDCSHWCLAGVPDTWNEILYSALLGN